MGNAQRTTNRGSEFELWVSLSVCLCAEVEVEVNKLGRTAAFVSRGLREGEANFGVGTRER